MANRISFLYLEHKTIDCDANALTARDMRGVMHIPGAALGVLMLGPGTSITHAARRLIGDNGATIVDVGEQGVRYYGHGRPLATSTKLLQAQARAFANDRKRLDVARAMYRMRFPDGEDIAKLGLRELRGREGQRVKKIYEEQAQRVGLRWAKRDYDPNDFHAGSPIDQALSAGHACLYGITHVVIVALGLSPGLGFVHTGHYPAFVHDVADLYKAELSIPIAFDVAVSGTDDIARDVRKRIRNQLVSGKLIARCVADLQRLFGIDEDDENWLTVERSHLWDDLQGEVAGGVNYSHDKEPD